MTTAHVPLRRNLRFQVLWIGSVVGFLGVEAADIAYPLAILGLTGSPAQAGLFGAIQTLATVLVGLPAGQIVDRVDRRTVLVLAETTRAAAGASVAIALATHHLTLAHTLAVAAALGAAGPFSGTARMLLVRSVVPAEQLTAALTQEQVRNNATALVGPPLGGFLYGLRTLLPFLASAVTFTVSLACALVVRVPAHEPVPRASRSGALAGVRTILTDPTLRAAALLAAAINTATAPLTLTATVLLRRQAVPPTLIGVALAGLAVGGLLGASLVGWLHRRLRPGVLLIGYTLLLAPLVAALALPWGPWWLGGVLLVCGLGLPALQVLVDVLIVRQVPDERRGRVIAAVITLFSLGIPVGTAAGGVLLQFLSPSAAMFLVACLLGVCGLTAASRRALRTARWPA